MADFRALCAALLDEIPHESPTTCLARSALAQPEPQEPTDEELWEAYDQMDGVPEDWPWCRDYARAVLTRWGHPTPQPIPVSERLPGPEDCDAEDQCWLWRTDGTEEFWELVIPPNKIHEYNWTSQWKYTHWLPHHALPVPQQGE